MISSINEVVNQAKESPPLKLAVAAAGDPAVLHSVFRAWQEGIIEPILVGEREKIEQAIDSIESSLEARIVEVKSSREAASRTMELISQGEADFPMKGLLSSGDILKALLNKEYGLRQEGLLSLVSLIYLEREERLVFMTDAGLNIAPDLTDKAEIIKNAVTIARSIGLEKPRVAPLAAVEMVNEKMPVTQEAAQLSKMAERGQIKNCLVDGPLALDNAILPEAAEHKGIAGEVAGKADILLVPDIEAGNILYKAWILYAGFPSASLVYGARVPLVMTSRADSPETKYNSIALGKLVIRGLNELSD